MSRALALLISLLIALGPAVALADTGCVCMATTISDSGSGDSTGGCCVTTGEGEVPPTDEPIDERPCDGQECSLVCCGTVKNVAAPQCAAAPSPDRPRVPSALVLETRRGSPHTLELKRPPRPNPRA